MSFQILKLPARIVGHEARYRVGRNGKSVALSLRPDTAKAAGLPAGCYVLVAIGVGEHKGQLALKRDDSKTPPSHARRTRLSGASLMVEIPYAPEIKAIFPAAPKNAAQTMPLEVLETDKEGAITVRKPVA